MRALPAPTLKPRKGLKVGEQSEDALLTPSQLDDEGRNLGGEGYFRFKSKGREGVAEKEEQEKLTRRRLHEIARRGSEVGLVGIVVLVVLGGRGVWPVAWQWKLELLAHLGSTAVLILVYPVKLSIVDTSATYSKPWQRFRVPASFDPATVLYPPLLPILVALLVSPTNPTVILPNIIIGLSSLPQRLFPRSSRLGGFNAVHWLFSIIPLIVAGNGKWLQSALSINDTSLSEETLVSLYPLHHALLTPLHHLTTTSLLISELHLLSAALINLLLFARSPQSVILNACLWIGGVLFFASAQHVLHWNVTLARVPKWKFRRPGHAEGERRSLIDAAAEVISLQKATRAFKRAEEGRDSDADEDLEPNTSIKASPSKLSPDIDKVSSRNASLANGLGAGEMQAHSASEPTHALRSDKEYVRRPPSSKLADKPRRNTAPVPDVVPDLGSRQDSKKKKARSGSMLWCLRLTPDQAERRKWLYAAYVYATVVIIILGPIRGYVAAKAFVNHEPIGWALSYLLGQTSVFRDAVGALGVTPWIPLPQPSMDIRAIRVSLESPLDVPVLRYAVGAANIRLLLIVYWGLILLAGLLGVFSLTAYVEVDTRRKVFHGVMVAMLLPATFVDPCYCALALALVLAIFLLLEVIRAAQIPPLGTAIGRFVAPYVDGRDLRGPVVVSHLFLLIGCAVPLWFSLAGLGRQDDGSSVWRDWETEAQKRDVGMIAGVVCVGMGDAAASLIGRRYGRRKWAWVGGKSLEGSAAFALAVTGGLLFAKAWLQVGGWRDVEEVDGVLGWTVAACKAVFCACGASFMEAVLTGANDNVVVPVALWLLVKGVRL